MKPPWTGAVPETRLSAARRTAFAWLESFERSARRFDEFSVYGDAGTSTANKEDGMLSSYFGFPGRPATAALLSLGLALIGGCGSTPSIRQTPAFDLCKAGWGTCVVVVIPPEMVAAGGLKRVAVRAGSGQGAAALAGQLEQRLSSVVVNDKPFYTLVRAEDPTRQGTFDLSSTEWSIDEQRETQSRSKCVDDKCKKSTEYKVSCTVRKATVGALMRLRSRDGSEIATRAAGGVASSTQCQGEVGTLDAPGLVLGKAAGQAMDRLQDALAVRTALKRVRVMDDAAGVTDPGRRQRFSDAVAFAKAGRMDRACPVFAELSEIETTSIAVFYNLGFCDQVNGDWRQAFRSYSKADSNSSKPLSEIGEALDETRAYGAQK